MATIALIIVDLLFIIGYLCLRKWKNQLRKECENTFRELAFLDEIKIIVGRISPDHPAYQANKRANIKERRIEIIMTIFIIIIGLTTSSLLLICIF